MWLILRAAPYVPRSVPDGPSSPVIKDPIRNDTALGDSLPNKHREHRFVSGPTVEGKSSPLTMISPPHCWGPLGDRIVLEGKKSFWGYCHDQGKYDHGIGPI